MSYLDFDHHWKKWGRIQSLSTESIYLQIQFVNGETYKFRYKEEFAQFTVGDWVAIDNAGQPVRVTPSLRKPLDFGSFTTQRKWSEFFLETQLYFTSKNFLHIPTPSLVQCPGTEPTLQPFSTTLVRANQSELRYLPTSPELHLKKSLALGFEKVFEVAKCYRNSEITDFHQPEFWMLEWYRSFSSLEQLQIDCIDFILNLSKKLSAKKPTGVSVCSIPQLFKKILDVDLSPSWTRTQYLELAQGLGLRTSQTFSIDDLFFLIMLEKIEPTLDPNQLVFIEKYPPFQAALARCDAQGWAQRFEMYWQGMELANAFNELNNPSEQRFRAIEDLNKRVDGTKIQLDEEFFQALEAGMPPSVGIALGLDRLFMALFEIKKIQETRLFPV